MNFVSGVGNIGSAVPCEHPDGRAFTIVKRDIPSHAVLVYEEDAGENIVRLVKAYLDRGSARQLQTMLVNEERAARRPDSFPVALIDGPVSSPGLTCRPDGSLKARIPAGKPKSDGYCGLYIDIIPNACPAWTPQGTWPLTVAATDDTARRLALGAQQRADGAAATANDAGNAAGDVLKRVKAVEKAISAGGSSISPDQVLKTVSDDIASDTGALRHALFPRVAQMVKDIIYLMLKDAASPLINVIKQGGKVIE
jgi:hypothetical protein